MWLGLLPQGPSLALRHPAWLLFWTMEQPGIDPRGLAAPWHRLYLGRLPPHFLQTMGSCEQGPHSVIPCKLSFCFENKALGSRVSFSTPGLRQWNWDLPHLPVMLPVLLGQGHLQKPDPDLSLAPLAQHPGRNHSHIKSRASPNVAFGRRPYLWDGVTL